jgi:hypothetical protein
MAMRFTILTMGSANAALGINAKNRTATMTLLKETLSLKYIAIAISNITL